MTASRSGGSPAARVTIVRAVPADAAALTEIAIAAKRHWGYPERWMESWRELLTITPAFVAQHETYTAMLAGRRVGFYALSIRGSRPTLAHLWVVPDRIRRGVGRALLAHALGRVRTQGHRELEIESDPNAEGFYRRMGARRVGVSVGEVEGERRELPVLTCPVDHPDSPVPGSGAR